MTPADATTPATQSLLPVTPEDVTSFLNFAFRHIRLPLLDAGDIDDIRAGLEQFRQAHSLPGDVGMRGACTNAFLAGYEAGENGDGLDASLDNYLATTPRTAPGLSEHLTTKLRSALRFSASHSVMSSDDEQEILAALTPSALSGDAGEGE